jgi:hypothetical protein
VTLEHGHLSLDAYFLKKIVESLQLSNKDLYLLMQSNAQWLKTVKNFALSASVTPSYIYKLVKEHKMELVLIDGVSFVDTAKFPTIPVTNRRK